MKKETIVSMIFPEIGDGYITGFDGDSLVKGDGLVLSYSDGHTEKRVLENITTNMVENPLNGLTEVTIKVFMKKVEG